MINGYRIRQARELLRLNQADLAEKLGVTQSTIAQIEGGRFQPSEELVEALTMQLGYPLAFFTQDDPPHFPQGSMLWRAHSGLSALEKAEAHRYGQLIYEISLKLSKHVKNKTPLRLPQLAEEPTSPVIAAQLTRDVLGLSPDMPIPHLVRAMEQIGVLVFPLPTHLEGRDAYSLWNRFPTLWTTQELTRPIIVLSGGVPGDRLRFSLAHELGHLVMHQSIQGASSALEDEAQQFAAEILMPETAAREKILPPVTISSLVALKPQWGMSIQALLLRARDLEIISYRQYRTLYDRIRHYDWQEHEPVEIVPEKPRALRQMIEMVYGSQIDYMRLAADLCISPYFMRRLVQAFATKEEFTMRTITPGDGTDNSSHIRNIR